MTHGLSPRETQRACGLHLTLGDGLDARAERLANVGTVADGEPQDSGEVGAQLQEARERVVDPEELDQERDTPDDLDVERGCHVDRQGWRTPAQSREEPQKQGEEHRHDGHLEGDHETITDEAGNLGVGIGLENDAPHDERHGEAQRDPPGDHQAALARDGCAVILPDVGMGVADLSLNLAGHFTS